MEVITMTLAQLHQVHQALDRDRHAFVTSLPEQVADRLLAYSLTTRLHADYEQRERSRAQNREAQRRRRQREALELPDDLS